MAKESRIRYALQKHLEWIEARLKILDDKRDEIENMLKNLGEPPYCCCKAGEEAKNVKIKQKINQQQSKSQDEDENKVKTTSKLTPYVCRYLRHKFILQNLLDQIQLDTNENSLHALRHQKADLHFHPIQKTYFDFSKKRPENLKYTQQLANPKPIFLQHAIDNFSNFMSHDKRERIKCQLKCNSFNKGMMRPEDLEDKVREKIKPKPKMKNIGEKIKHQLSKQLYELLAKFLKKKMIKEMARDRTSKIVVSQPFREMEKTIVAFLIAVNGSPKSKQECEMYKKFSSIIGEFLMKALKETIK